MRHRRLQAYALVVIGLGALVLVSADKTQAADRTGAMALSAATPPAAGAVCPQTCGVCQTSCPGEIEMDEDCEDVCGTGSAACSACFDLDPEQHTCNGGEPPEGYDKGWWCEDQS